MKLNKSVFLATIYLLGTSLLLNGQLKYVSYSKETIPADKFEVIDIAFMVKKTIEEPFSIDFGAVFTGPNGEKLNIPGFYNGEKEWLLRFSANKTGVWTYETYSGLKALDGKKGMLEITSSASKKHGAVQVSKSDPKKFDYEDGSPYMLQAFECDWLFALDYDNADATPKAEHLLGLLADNGINQIVTTLYSYDVKWEKDDKLKEHPEHEYGALNQIFPFLGTNQDPDYSALNITFFQGFDRMVSLMDQNEIVAHLMIYVWNKLVSWPDTESAADNMYFDYVVKRYQAFPNVIWDISKEALNNPRCTEAYGLERIQRIDSLDAYNRLVTVHDFGFCKRNTEAVDFISTQTWVSTLYTKMLDMYQEFEKPVFNIEHGGYELSPYTVFPGAYDNPEVNLRRNYLCYFAGVYATYYWQGAAWNVIIHNPFELDENFVKPKFEYYKHLHSFFSKIGYEKFHPFPQANKSGYCLKSDDEVYLYFIPKENYQLSMYGAKDAGVRSGSYQWFNTYTGEYTEEKSFTGGNMKAPWPNEADAILIRRVNK